MLSIYSQNLSGASSKLHRINEFLANTEFQIISLQETWFTDTVSTDEMQASTNFSSIGTDRSCSLNKRKKGGGLITFIHNDWDFEEIRLNQKFLV